KAKSFLINTFQAYIGNLRKDGSYGCQILWVVMRIGRKMCSGIETWSCEKMRLTISNLMILLIVLSLILLVRIISRLKPGGLPTISSGRQPLGSMRPPFVKVV